MGMYLIVGLGNPGKKYENTRHNAGFDSLDVLAENLEIKVNRVWCKAVTGKGNIGSEKVLLAKPQTFMNLSGQSVASLMKFYKIDLDHLIVIYDDKELDAGKLRIRKSGSAGGHNGMKDIIKMTGSQDFIRVRVGVGRCPAEIEVVDYVLGHHTSVDKPKMEQGFKDAADAVVDIIKKGADFAMNKYN